MSVRYPKVPQLIPRIGLPWDSLELSRNVPSPPIEIIKSALSIFVVISISSSFDMPISFLAVS